MTWKTAKYAGRCRCGADVMQGDRIDHSPAFGVVVCPSCDDTEPRAGRATGSDITQHKVVYYPKPGGHINSAYPRTKEDRRKLVKEIQGRGGVIVPPDEAADDRALFQSMEMDGLI